MKSKIIIILLLIITILLYGCQNNNETNKESVPSQANELSKLPKKLLVESEKIIENTKEYIISMDIPGITIPGFEKIEQDINADLTAFAEKSVMLFKDKVTELEENTSIARIGMEYIITTNENGFLSIFLLSTDCFGEEEMTYKNAFNYHVGDVRELSLKDLLGDQYIEIINDEIKRQINSNDESKNSVIEEFESIDQQTEFYLSDGKLIVFFERCDLFDYDYGIPEFEIPDSIYKPYTKRD